jgi:hypothetical protein
MPDDSTYSTSHGAVGVQMAVNLKINFPISLNQQLKEMFPTIESLS